MKHVVLAVMLVTGGLAGCIGDDDTPAEPASSANATNATTAGVPEDPITALSDCSPCFEPSGTWTADGELVVTDSWPYGPQNLSRSTDRGHEFETVEPPPLPEGLSRSGDVLLQSDRGGSLWWTALRETDTGTTIQVARSDDGARSWALNRIVEMPLLGEPTGTSEDSDRQWLLFGQQNRVHLVCSCPLGSNQMRTSTDSGETWSEPTQIPAPGRSGPVGKPALTPDGTIVAPYFAGIGGVSISGTTPSPRPLGVFASVSSDAGQTWDIVPVWTDPGRVQQDGRQWIGFPNAESTEDGNMYVGWTAGREALLATSTDGGTTWSDPTVWSDEETRVYPDWSTVGASHVWIEAVGETTVASSWFSGSGDQATVELAWGDAEGVEGRRSVGQGQVRTDHPYVSVSPDGLLAVPFVDTGGNVSVTVLEDPTGEGG